MHDSIRVLGDIRPLRDPVLIAAFTGFTDATGGAVAAVHHIEETWDATPIASIEPEPFYDFTVQRPHVRTEDDGERVIDWPENLFSVASPPGADRDFLLLSGAEPHLHWRTFIDIIEEILRATGSTTSVTLSAQPAAVPHTRPLGVTLSASHPEFESTFDLKAPASRYQGPTGIVGVLNLHLRKLGWKNASLWALVPHYLTLGPNPNAAISLAQRLDRGFGTQTPLEGLEEEARAFEFQVRQALDESLEAKAYVQQLEEQYDAIQVEGAGAAGEPSSDLPATPDLLEDLDNFLRDQRDPGSS